MRTDGKALLIRLLALLLVAGAVSLGILQVQWVNAAAREEEGRLREAIAIGASRVRRDAEDEIWVLTSLVSLGSRELAERDWDRLEQSLRFWRSSATHPGLLREVAILADPAGGSGCVYALEDGRFREGRLDPELVAVVRGVLDARDAAALREQSALAEERGLFVVPVYEGAESALPREAGPVVRALGAVAVRVDTTVFYGEVLRDLLQRHLEGFLYRVRRGKAEVTLLDSGGIPGGALPEAVVNLSALSFGLPNWLLSRAVSSWAKPPELREPEQGAAEDPALRYWLYHARSQRTSPEEASPDAQAGRAPPVRLEVYYPGGSIGRTIALRRTLGLAIGVGVLSMLVLSAFVLYRMYRRSAGLRAREQELVASVSHELRTPITVIQATSENLRRGLVTDAGRVAQYATVIGEQIRRLASMVEGILLYSGLQQGVERRPAMDEIDPARLLDDVALPLREVAASRGKRLAVSAKGLPAAVCSDQSALRLILENLIMNAIRHAGAGTIVAAMERQGTSMAVTVADEGPGIPPREQARVFEPFARGSRSIREQAPGSGLGLHLVKRVAAALGGSVRLESPYTTPEGRRVPGCRFVVTLPIGEGRDG